ncbi:hypothetical protein HJ588_10865 [Flexivirga sp. ID2601S]|uniref:Uncharacterized protein n=1 Tax=Flexivirga aerilata TaxID=1656889 RepID=A0A849AKC7_9MICO|nr:hypothetical protein [Flexivirga aerilata]NNG39771.1 hypothetical protein [Flexivirga aerilata]
MEPLPKYWIAARKGSQTAWGWSSRSLDDARAVGYDRLARLLAAVHDGTIKGSYGWAPPRELTLHEEYDGAGVLIGVVSRNRYGADVLNTDHFLVADIDVQQSVAQHGRRLLRRAFGRAEETADGPKALALHRIGEFASAHPSVGVRVYETFGGFRAILTGTGLPPDSPGAAALFEELATDRVYARLCRKYQTCRARLTPKPWRTGLRASAPAWPAEDASAAEQWVGWLRDYQGASARYATCRLVETFGPPPRPAEQRLIDLHDRVSRAAETALPLA